MLSASVQNGSSLFSEFASQSTSRTSAFEGNRRSSFSADLANLVSSIQSGNSSNAQQYLTQIEKLVPSNANSNSPLSQFLSSVSSALSNNDIAGAQSALSTFENQRAPAPASPSATTASPAPATAAGGSTTNPLGQDVLSLFTAIGSGNLAGAQSAYDTVTSLLLSGSSSSPSSAVSTAASSGSSSTSSSFVSLLSQIGSALSTGDIGSAQTAVDSFLQSLSAGSLVGATA